jgi:hypothetical protein
MSTMLRRTFLSALLVSGAFWAAETAETTAQPAETAPDLVRVLTEKRASGPDKVEVAYTLECRGAAPSLRVTLGQGAEYNASAGVTLPVDGDDRALGTVSVAVVPVDKAAGTYALSVEIGPGGPTTLSRVLHVQADRELPALADLREPAETSPFRHAIVLGNVGGSMLSAYVMPGRSGARTPTPAPTRSASEAAAQATEAFRTWASAVKRGDLEQFATIVPAAEWGAMNPEQKAERLKEYQDSFTTVLGAEYAPEQFQVEYAGSGAFGRLKIRYGDKALPDLTARFVGGRWIITEP